MFSINEAQILSGGSDFSTFPRIHAPMSVQWRVESAHEMDKVQWTKCNGHCKQALQAVLGRWDSAGRGTSSSVMANRVA